MAVSTAVRPLLDTIAKGEAPGGYNQRFGERAGSPKNDLVNMTINEVLALPVNRQGGHVSSANGRYQIIDKTLSGLVKEMGLTGNEKFDAAMQDRMAVALLERRGLADFQSGKITANQFLNNLAKEWASLPTTSGRGYYSGQGAAHAPASVINVLNGLSGQPPITSKGMGTQLASAGVYGQGGLLGTGRTAGMGTPAGWQVGTNPQQQAFTPVPTPPKPNLRPGPPGPTPPLSIPPNTPPLPNMRPPPDDLGGGSTPDTGGVPTPNLRPARTPSGDIIPLPNLRPNTAGMSTPNLDSVMNLPLEGWPQGIGIEGLDRFHPAYQAEAATYGPQGATAVNYPQSPQSAANQPPMPGPSAGSGIPTEGMFRHQGGLSELPPEFYSEGYVPVDQGVPTIMPSLNYPEYASLGGFPNPQATEGGEGLSQYRQVPSYNSEIKDFGPLAFGELLNAIVQGRPQDEIDAIGKRIEDQVNAQGPLQKAGTLFGLNQYIGTLPKTAPGAAQYLNNLKQSDPENFSKNLAKFGPLQGAINTALAQPLKPTGTQTIALPNLRPPMPEPQVAEAAPPQPEPSITRSAGFGAPPQEEFTPRPLPLNIQQLFGYPQQSGGSFGQMPQAPIRAPSIVPQFQPQNAGMAAGNALLGFGQPLNISYRNPQPQQAGSGMPGWGPSAHLWGPVGAQSAVPQQAGMAVPNMVPQQQQQPRNLTEAVFGVGATGPQNVTEMAMTNPAVVAGLFAEANNNSVYEKPEEMTSWGGGWGYDETQFLPDLDAISGHGW